jgi:hypothetical protein
VIQLNHRFEGPFQAGCYDVTLPNGRQFTVKGKAASMISLILAGYSLRPGFMPLDAFTEESLEAGRTVKAGNSEPR